MAYNFSFTRRAEADLDLLFLRIDAENSEAALKWYVGLREAVLSLEANPTGCPFTPESKSYRHLLYGKRADTYRVIFRVFERAKEVLILHIRHGAQRPFTSGDLN